MKALKKLSVTAIALMAMVQLSSAAISIPVADRLNANTTSNGQMVKAILNEGVYMPVVDLPVVEIISAKPGNMVVKGIIEKGEVIAVVDLPTIEIAIERPFNTIDNQYLEYSEIRDIPVIEIVDYFPETNLITGVVSGEQGMPVVELPEVIISVDKSYQSQWLAFVNEAGQHDIRTNVTHPDVKVILGQLESNNELITNLSMELQQCLALNKRTVVCEFVSETGNYVSENLQQGILRLIFKN